MSTGPRLTVHRPGQSHKADGRRDKPRPHPHQQMLHERQLIGVVAHFVQQTIDKVDRNVAAEDPGGADNRCAPFLTAQPWRQVLAAVHRLRQTGKCRTIAEEVRAHRQHDVDRYVPLPRRLDQQRDKRIRLVNSTFASETEYLLELIDQDKQVGVWRKRRLAQRFDQPEVGRGAGSRRATLSPSPDPPDPPAQHRSVPSVLSPGRTLGAHQAASRRIASVIRRLRDSRIQALPTSRRGQATTCRSRTAPPRRETSWNAGGAATRPPVLRGRKTGLPPRN